MKKLKKEQTNYKYKQNSNQVWKMTQRKVVKFTNNIFQKRNICEQSESLEKEVF